MCFFFLSIATQPRKKCCKKRPIFIVVRSINENIIVHYMAQFMELLSRVKSMCKCRLLYTVHNLKLSTRKLSYLHFSRSSTVYLFAGVRERKRERESAHSKDPANRVLLYLLTKRVRPFTRRAEVTFKSPRRPALTRHTLFLRHNLRPIK